MYGIEEALTAIQAGALVQKRIDPLVNELQRRYAPLLAAIPSEAWNSTVFNWDVRTALPSAGPVSDGGARPVTASTYTQKNVTIQHILAVGAVTGYAEAVTQSFGSLRGREIMGAIRSMEWAAETQIMGGNATATALGLYPQFNGLDVLCSAFTGTTQNCITLQATGGATGFTLATLDLVIDMVENNVAETISPDDWFFVVSSTLESRIAQLMVRQQRFNNLPRATVAAGLNVLTYRNIPLVKSSFLSARNRAMTTVTATTATTGGHLPDTKRYYAVTAVLPTYGESKACTTVTVTPGSGTDNIVTLSFTPPATSTGAPVLLYKVYEGTAADSLTLLGYVDGTVGASGKTPILTTSIVDTGVKLVPHHGSTVPIAGPTTYVNKNSAYKPQPTNGQDFYLLSRDPANVKRPYVRDCIPVPNLAPTVTGPDQLPYALITDTALGLRMPRFVGRGHGAIVTLQRASTS